MATKSPRSRKKPIRKKVSVSTSKFDLYLWMLGTTGFDVIEIFGDTGSGKTTVAKKVANDATALGKKVLYIDVEKNFVKAPKVFEYKYIVDFDDVYTYIKEIDKDETKYDLIILDSLGLPVLGRWAEANMKERGDILTKCSAISYIFKKYSIKYNAMVLMTNQPESIFAKKKSRKELKPFGDKHAFFVKDIMKSFLKTSNSEHTICDILSWRMRSYGKFTKLFSVKITTENVIFLEPEKK